MGQNWKETHWWSIKVPARAQLHQFPQGCTSYRPCWFIWKITGAPTIPFSMHISSMKPIEAQEMKTCVKSLIPRLTRATICWRISIYRDLVHILIMAVHISLWWVTVAFASAAEAAAAPACIFVLVACIAMVVGCVVCICMYCLHLLCCLWLWCLYICFCCIYFCWLCLYLCSL